MCSGPASRNAKKRGRIEHDGQAVRTKIGHGHIGQTVAIEVGGCGRTGTGLQRQLDGGRKNAATYTDQDRERIVSGGGDGHIGDAVGVKIGDSNRSRISAGRKIQSGGGGGSESSVAIPQEDRNAVDHGIGAAGHGSTIRDDQIENLIGVHVRERDENRGHPGRVLDRAEKRSVSLANISFERVFRRVGDGQIDDRVGIRIEGSGHDRGWLHAGRNQRGRLKSSVGVAQINADRVIALVHYRQIGKTVIVEIGHRD